MAPQSGASITAGKVVKSAMQASIEFAGLTSDSREVKPGYLVCGTARHARPMARAFVKDAVARGAIAVLGRPDVEAEAAALGVRFIADDNPRRALARHASAFFDAQPEIVAAVTGTKGKSSIVAFLREIWTALGKPAASLGTVGVVTPKGEIPLKHTTPDPIEIHRLLAQLKRDGIDHLALEASSHGLDQYRLDGVDDRGRGLHQHHPRSHGLSRDLRALPRRQAAPVRRNRARRRRRGDQCGCRARGSLSCRGKGARAETADGRRNRRDHQTHFTPRPRRQPDAEAGLWRPHL